MRYSSGKAQLRSEPAALVREPLSSEATAETEHEMESRLLLDVVVGQGATVLELLASEDEALLIGGDALLVLDLGLHVVDGVRRLDLESDSFTREGLDENLHDVLGTWLKTFIIINSNQRLSLNSATVQ